MCFYEQKLWTCGTWRWSDFREQCKKEQRIGETCGLKLVYKTIEGSGDCKICSDKEIKLRRYKKMESDVLRWEKEQGRPATVEFTRKEMKEVEVQILRLEQQHKEEIELRSTRSNAQEMKYRRRVEEWFLREASILLPGTPDTSMASLPSPASSRSRSLLCHFWSR